MVTIESAMTQSHKKRSTHFLLIATVFLALLASRVEATPMLTISGDAAKQTLTREQLIQLADRTIKTQTPWTEGEQVFLGVSAQKLLETVNKPAHSLKAYALNDYWATIPRDDIKKYNPIFAIKKNGDWMRVRDKGPIWVIYPLSAFSQLENEVLHSRMAWQVNRVEVLKE
ncbi:oxidoreductase [Salinivibrio sp. MA440]|uniref:oxidoreductase n=1 Tax=Salinivibrio sp. MA440 TaxID=1909456 RepID=UPI000D52B4B8|nr:oxidoreductase [Salinivibrio sp. MA440]